MYLFVTIFTVTFYLRVGLVRMPGGGGVKYLLSLESYLILQCFYMHKFKTGAIFRSKI